MANLGQLAQIRGALQGYDAGEMNEQQLQQWLINFREQQRQFNTQSGQQQGYLDIAKGGERRTQEKHDVEMPLLKAEQEEELKMYKLLRGMDYADDRAKVISGTMRKKWRDIADEELVHENLRKNHPDIFEQLAKGEYEQARIGAKTPQQTYDITEENLRQQRGVADITTVEAELAPYMARVRAIGERLKVKTAEVQLQQIIQEVEAFPIDKEQRRQYLAALTKQLEVATTGAEFENMLNSLLKDVTAEGRRLANEATQEGIASSKAQTGIRQFEAETRRMSVNLAKEAKGKLDAAGERGYSDSTVNVLFKEMLDSRTELEEQIFDALESPLKKEQIGMMDNWIKAYKQTYNNTAAMLSGAGLGLVIDWTEQPLNVRQRGGAFRLWLDKDVPKTLPYPRSTRVMTPEEQAAYAERGTIPAFGQPSAATLRRPTTTTPTPTTGLTAEVRQQYIDRVKQAPDAEIQAVQNEFLGKYSNAEWNKIIREAMK